MIGTPPHSIVHPTDFSSASLDAFAHALRIAVAARSLLHILHVEGGERDPDMDRFPRVREMLAQWRMIDADATRAAVAEGLGVKVVKATIESKSPVRGISAYAERHACDLLALMTHSRRGLQRWLEGSVAEVAARATRAPTLFLREGQKGFVNRETGAVSLDVVLMPVDASVSPLAAFRRIADIAHAIEPSVKIQLLHVGAELPIFEGLLPHVELREGPVVETILSYAQEIGADLIAMPTSGRHGLLDALRGSTTEQALHDSPCPVLAVPAK